MELLGDFFNPRDDWGDAFDLELRWTPPPKSAAAAAAAGQAGGGGGGGGGARAAGRAGPSEEKLISPGAVMPLLDGEPGQYTARVVATVADRPSREYTVILTTAGATAAAIEAAARAAEEGGGEAAAAAAADEEAEMTDEQRRLADEAAEADLRAEAEADAEAEKVLRAQNGAPPPPTLSFFTLATLMSRLNAWRTRGAAAAIKARRRNKRLYTGAVSYSPAPTDPLQCVMSGDGLWSAREMARTRFTIQPRDEYGNPTDEAADAWCLKIVRAPEPAGGGGGRGGAAAAAAAAADADGSWDGFSGDDDDEYSDDSDEDGDSGRDERGGGTSVGGVGAEGEQEPPPARIDAGGFASVSTSDGEAGTTEVS